MPDGEVTAVKRVPTGTEGGLRASPAGQDVFGTLSKTINDGLVDLSAVVIRTAWAKMDTDIKIIAKTGELKDDEKEIDVRLGALTSIGLDGDILEVIPPENVDAQKRAEIMQIHDKNVERGVNNWNNFVDGIIKIVRIAADLSGHSLPNSFNDAGKVVKVS